MKLERRTDTDSSIPTSSMSDIAFLLIIFFMVTAVFSVTKGLAMRLPGEKKGNPGTDPGVLIQVGPGGILVDCKPMAVGEILPYLEPRLLNNPNKPVILYPSPDVEYRRVVEVYDLLIGTSSADDPGEITVHNIFVPTRTDIADYVDMFNANPFETHCR